MKKLGLLVMPLMAVSLLASCNQPKPQVVDHFVTFESYGGDHIPTQRVKDGETATEPNPEPIRGGDQFLGWFTDFDKPAYTFTEKVTDDITLYAGWEVTPDPATTCSFKFTGTNCSINGYKDVPFEITLPKGTQTQFQINPDDGYLLPTDDETHFKIIKGSINEYDPATGLIKIGNMSNDIEIEAKSESVPPVPVESYKVTFDAGDGSYSTGKTLSAVVKSSTKLLPLLNVVEVPTLTNKVFAYYQYDNKEKLISYDDVITSDITLVAQYFDASKVQQDTLDFTWKEIKQVAVTNKNPSTCFKLGATKTVSVNNKNHTVRIIDFKHKGDVTKSGEQTGITFEFANVITKTNEAKAYSVIWSSNYNYDYRNSIVNDFLNDETPGKESVINMLPTDSVNIDLKEVIEPVDKKVGVNESKAWGRECYTAISFEKSKFPKLFLLAYGEVTDPANEAGVTEEEGSEYQYYISHSNLTDRIKTAVGSGDGLNYWFRSPYILDNGGVWFIRGYDGLVIAYNCYQELAVAPAFCI